MHNIFFKFLKESFRDLLPIIFVILFFQLIILKTIPDNRQETSLWIIIVGVWLALFLMWLQYWIFPIWESLTKSFSKKKWFFWMKLFGFLIWFSTTIAEPALFVIAQEASIISGWRIDANTLRYVVAWSVWFAVWLWILRIIKWYPIHYFIIVWYVLVISITYFTPQEIIWLAYDLWWITTSTVTVPLVAAIWIWLATHIKHRDPLIDWFWIIAFASLTPMIFVQIYGIFIYTFWESSEVLISSTESVVEVATNIDIHTILTGLAQTIKDILPIIFTIFFFQYVILKKSIPYDELKNIILWFIMVIFWLYLFIMWLEMWLFNLWEDMALQLTTLDKNWLIYAFAFLIGFSTTMAEPTLIAIANKAKSISWKIDPLILRSFVAVWVWIWITIWTYRIINWGHIQNYIMIWYFVVLIITYFAPKYIIPIAYDSGWVTTSTITVPIVAALWIWLATNIDWRNPLIDGFWLIAFASLFPIMTVMIYGIINTIYVIKVRNKYRKDVSHILPEISED